jgi:hypothetical protein
VVATLQNENGLGWAEEPFQVFLPIAHTHFKEQAPNGKEVGLRCALGSRQPDQQRLTPHVAATGHSVHPPGRAPIVSAAGAWLWVTVGASF